MRNTRWLIIMLLGSLAAGVMAQEATAPLTDVEAVQIALKNNPLIKAAQAEAGMAKARVGVAQADGALQVSAGGVFSLGNMGTSLSVPSVMPPANPTAPNTTGGQLEAMAMLPLSTGGRISATTRAAKRTQAAADSRIAEIQVQVARDARLRLADWREAVAMARVADDNLSAQSKATDVAKALFDVGKIPRFDLLRSQAALADAKQLVANAKADVIAAKAQVAQVLGVDTATLHELADDTLAEAPDQTLETALAQRPELIAAQHTIEAAEAMVSARKAAYRPQIYAYGMVGGGSPAEMDKSVGMSVGVMAGLPLVDGGRRQAEVQEAQQGVEQAKALRESLVLQVRADVEAAEARVAAAHQNMETAAAQVSAAEESYAVAQSRYAAGKSIVVELLDALKAQTDAQQSLVTAQAQYRKALAELYAAMGIDVPATQLAQ